MEKIFEDFKHFNHQASKEVDTKYVEKRFSFRHNETKNPSPFRGKGVKEKVNSD